jgi:peptide/nickel transport system substrate-binding protein
MRIPPLLRAVLCAAIVPVLAACPGDRTGAPFEVGDPEPGGTGIVAVTSDFQPFNPVTNTALVTSEVINFMLFTPLIQFDENLEPVPALAESWDLTDQGVTFRLRNDVTWHDGQPVTAEDVLFTFELAKNPATASLLESAFLTMVQGAQVIDPQTIQFTFVAPHSQPLQAFWWPPVPRHLLGDVDPGQLVQAPFGREPVGNGPFRFASWAPGQQLTLEANDAYPAGLGGRPMLDRVVFRIVPEATTRLTEILTGAIDVNYSLLPDEARQVEGQRNVELINYPGREFLYIGWNNEREPFRDPRVRQALAMGIDRSTYVEALMFGYAEPAAGMIAPWSPVHSNVDPLPYDPAAARQLLQEAGWTPGADGIMTRNGQPLRFTMMSSEDRLRQDITVVAQQQLRQIGADVQVRAMEFQTLLQQHRNREYDSVVSGWSLDTFRVDPSPLFSCAEARNVGSPNRAGYCNPDADRLMTAGLQETDDARAEEIWGEFTSTLQRDQPITFLVWTEQLAAVGQRLQGVEMDVRGKLQSAPRWWIPAGQRR